MKQTIKIEGMSCGHCESRVRTGLEELGVEVLKVSAKENIAEIDNFNDTSMEKIKEAIDDAGYEVVELY